MEEGSGTIPRAGEVRFCAEDASGNCNVCKGFGHRPAEMLRSLNWYAKNFANFRFDVCASARARSGLCVWVRVGSGRSIVLVLPFLRAIRYVFWSAMHSSSFGWLCVCVFFLGAVPFHFRGGFTAVTTLPQSPQPNRPSCSRVRLTYSDYISI